MLQGDLDLSRRRLVSTPSRRRSVTVVPSQICPAAVAASCWLARVNQSNICHPRGVYLHTMPHPFSLEDILDTLVLFANDGGASASQIAWELCVEEHQVTQAWQHAARDRLIQPVGHDRQHLIYQLTAAGWATQQDERART